MERRPKLPSALNDAESIKSAVKSGNINISTEYMPMSIEDALSKEKQAGLDEIERKRRARLMNVSTDDQEVKKDLRTVGEPICLFGEGPADRRHRLKDILSRIGIDALLRKEFNDQQKPSGDKEQEATWYHEGPDSLEIARQYILDFSMTRAKERLAEARRVRDLPYAIKLSKRQELQKRLQTSNICSSQVGDTRPISFIQFSPNSKMLATASWSGLIKLWSSPDCAPIRTLRGHNNNVGSVVFHPYSTINMEDEACQLASCGADGSVKLWNFVSDEPIADVPGHSARVSRVAYHPSGRFLATCCFDSSWRLWDLEQQEEVLHQEGHSKAVYCIAFQCDGSLAVTGGMDSFGRIWDLRTGRCIMFLEGHLKSILGVEVAPNGYQIVTGSEDNSCRIWDIRQRSCLYTIPAHTNLVSGVKCQPVDGRFIATSSYDNSAKLWLTGTWQPLRTLKGHDGRVMCVDVSPDSQYIATSSFDRTFKLWGADE